MRGIINKKYIDGVYTMAFNNLNVEQWKAYWATEWKVLLARIGISENALSKEVGAYQGTLNKQLKNGTIKLSEFSAILDKYGYELRIVKKSDN